MRYVHTYTKTNPADNKIMQSSTEWNTCTSEIKIAHRFKTMMHKMYVHSTRSYRTMTVKLLNRGPLKNEETSNKWNWFGNSSACTFMYIIIKVLYYDIEW